MGGCTSSTAAGVRGNPDDLVIVFVLGGPGSGKGTQCVRLSSELGFTHLSTGDLFRNEVKQETERATRVKAIMEAGELVPVETTLDILKDAVDSILATGGSAKLLIDGFPREVEQIAAFTNKFNRDCTYALFFDVSPEVMKARCIKRGEESGRVDDNAATIANRIDTYFEKSKPVVEHYETKGLLYRINAEADIDAVWEAVQTAVHSHDTVEEEVKDDVGKTAPTVPVVPVVAAEAAEAATPAEPAAAAESTEPSAEPSAEAPAEASAPTESAEPATTADSAASSEKKAAGITVTVCGGGNAAHIAAGMFANNGATVNLFFSFAEEATRFREACEANGGVDVESKTGSFKGKPAVITADPAEAIPQSDIVILIVPAFAHEPILRQIGPHLKEGAAVGAIPGPGAFDLIALNAIGDIIKAKNVTLFAGTSLPWACRFDEYGKKATLLGEKSRVDINTRPSKNEELNTRLANQMTALHNNTKFSCRGHFLTCTLWPTNAIIHPGVSYGIWHDWDGKPLEEAPLFYQNCNDFTGAVLDGLSNESAAAVKVLEEAGADLSNWQPIDVYQRDVYGDVIDDDSTTARIFATNDAFRGLKAPMTTTEDGKLVPNFTTRYLTEDLPHGLAVLRGICEICGVESPTMDKVLLWAQPLIGKEYLVDGKIQGKDVAQSGCPQRFGITTPEGLIKGEVAAAE